VPTSATSKDCAPGNDGLVVGWIVDGAEIELGASESVGWIVDGAGVELGASESDGWIVDGTEVELGANEPVSGGVSACCV
jgi:hypothetical protein